jgi:hypothetical protein
MYPRNVDVHPGSGRAVYQATNLPMPDHHDLASAVRGVPPIPGIVSFHIERAPSQDKHHYRYAPHQWERRFVQATATCTWSGHTEFAEFATDTNNPTIYAEVACSTA